jgi:hypothetical protein
MSVADSSSLSLWSALSLLGFILVILGVLFEGAEAFIWTFSWFRRSRLSIIWSMLPEPRIPRWAHRLDHVGWFFLVIGLALETWGHIRVTDITGRENRRLTAQLDSTTKSAASNELQVAELTSNILVLQTNVNETKTQLANAETRLIELRNENLPMNIGEQYSFANALRPLAGIQVELRAVLQQADWKPNGSKFTTTREIFQNGVLTEIWRGGDSNGHFKEVVRYDPFFNPISTNIPTAFQLLSPSPKQR